MSTKENCGAAFGEFKQAGDCAIKSGGITVRDYFAAKALETCAAYPREDVATWDAEDFAVHAYRVADAMLQELAK